MLPAGSPITTIDQIDQPGNRVSVKARAAYDLWLTDHLKHAKLIRVDTIDESFETFKRDNLEVLAGLRPALLNQQPNLPGATILDESFTAVQQSIGCKPGNDATATYLKNFVNKSIENGLIASLIEKHGVTGKLSVAPLS